MVDPVHGSAGLVLAYSVYGLGTASPGPSNLAIMATAMNAGRRPALALALGVVSGSSFWGLLAAFGLSAILATHSGALIALKSLGGLYLLWLAVRSAGSATSSRSALDAPRSPVEPGVWRNSLQGGWMHLTNPKAVFTWISIVSLALPPGAQAAEALWVVFGCALIGVLVFGTYAVAFSTAVARRVYQRTRRWFDGSLALVFGVAGIHLLLART